MTPDRHEKPEFGPPDPALFAPLTDDESTVLKMHLTSGWYKQGAVWPVLSDIWRETSELLDDMHAAWDIAFTAGQRARRAARPVPAGTTAGGAS